MGKRWVFIVLLLWLVAGCAAFEPLEVRERTFGSHPPMIGDSFASKTMRPGDNWYVYLKANDPDGDMKNILCTLYQPGVGEYPVGITRIKDQDRRELDGYLYLSTRQSLNGLNLVNLTLRVQIEDKAGHYSAPVSFPVSLNNFYGQEAPPANRFRDQDLGPIMIQVIPPGQGRDGEGIDIH